MKAMFAKTVSAKNIGEADRHTMYGLMQQYYECMAWDRFNKDLDDKDDVILLMDKETGSIKGFSTLKNIEIKIGKGKAFGVFSGDTVVDRAFWGQRVLGKAFLRYLFLQKARSKEIIVRVLRNLKNVYMKKNKLEAALSCCDRILLLEKDSMIELRERGLLCFQLDCFQEAQNDLERLLLHASAEMPTEEIQYILSKIRHHTRNIN